MLRFQFLDGERDVWDSFLNKIHTRGERLPSLANHSGNFNVSPDIYGISSGIFGLPPAKLQTSTTFIQIMTPTTCK